MKMSASVYNPLTDDNFLLVTAGKLTDNSSGEGVLIRRESIFFLAGFLNLFLVKEQAGGKTFQVSENQVILIASCSTSPLSFTILCQKCNTRFDCL